jgi:hypothetical protein
VSFYLRAWGSAFNADAFVAQGGLGSRLAKGERRQRLWQTLPRAYLDFVRGAPESHDAGEHAPVHPSHQRLFEEDRESRAAVALHFMWHNFGRVHQTLRVTPAMKAGVADHVWTVAEIVALLD